MVAEVRPLFGVCRFEITLDQEEAVAAETLLQLRQCAFGQKLTQEARNIAQYSSGTVMICIESR